MNLTARLTGYRRMVLTGRVYYDCTRKARAMMKRFDGLEGRKKL